MIPPVAFARLLAGAGLIAVGAFFAAGFEAASRFAPIVTAGAAAVGALIAYAAIWWNRRMARLKSTLDLFEGAESKEFYQARYAAYRSYRRADAAERERIADPTVHERDELRSKCQDFLNHYELVALAASTGLIDEQFYRQWMGEALVRDWNEAGALIRSARRSDGPKDVGNRKAYSELERLALRWGGRPLPPA
jgi:hypothetical protein